MARMFELLSSEQKHNNEEKMSKRLFIFLSLTLLISISVINSKADSTDITAQITDYGIYEHVGPTVIVMSPFSTEATTCNLKPIV